MIFSVLKEGWLLSGYLIEVSTKIAVSVNAAWNSLNVVGSYGFGLEVDGACGPAVRAAEVEDELAVNKYPQIVVTGEVEGLRCAILVDTVSIIAAGQVEGDDQLHTKAKILRVIQVVLIGNITITVKREESLRTVGRVNLFIFAGIVIVDLSSFV